MDLLQALDRTRDETLRHFELGLLGDIEGELLPGHHEAAHALANGRVIANAGLDSLGMVPADNLNPQKARILLMLALTRTTNLSEIQRVFAEY